MALGLFQVSEGLGLVVLYRKFVRVLEFSVAVLGDKVLLALLLVIGGRFAGALFHPLLQCISFGFAVNHHFRSDCFLPGKDKFVIVVRVAAIC